MASRADVQIRQLRGERQEMDDLQRVLEEAPRYAMTQTGHPPGSADAQSIYSILPPNKGYEDKFVYGVYVGDEMVGCVDLIRAYPDSKTAMLGLLLVSESRLGLGIGSEAFRCVEDTVRRWAGVEKIRIDITGTNAQVIPFWKKMGFEDTSVRKPYSYDKLQSETLVFEKRIIPTKHRFTMRRTLANLESLDSKGARSLRIEDAEAIGRLQERAYRGTVDDEGESLEQFVLETRATLEGKYGPFVSKASFWVEHQGQPIAATIITIWKSRPLLAFSVTDPSHQRKGHAQKLIRLSMQALARLGYEEIELGVTEGNPAMRLYEKLGFRIVPRE